MYREFSAKKCRTTIALLLFTALLQVRAAGMAQQITIKAVDLPLKEFIVQLHHKSGFDFMCTSEIINGADRITITAAGLSLEEVLKRALMGHPIAFVINKDERTVVLSKMETNRPNSPHITVNGRVLDNTGKPLPGATVKLKGTLLGVSTAEDGSFTLHDVQPDGVLEISYLGYAPLQVAISGRSYIEIKLQPKDTRLNDIVVVGYGSQSRRNVTGSVAKVDLQQVADLPNTNIDQAIRGRVAGVEFLDNGRPGQSGSILIRGTRSISAGNNPLVVMDGIIFNGSLADINPDDVGSMEILKDASAEAIYGSRAANGVILITSKKGSTDKPVIGVNSYAGISGYSHKMKEYNGPGYIQKLLDYRAQSGLPADPNQVASYLQNSEVPNYQDHHTIDGTDVISQNASVQSADLSISGRSNATNYYVSGNFTNEKGLYLNDNAQKISFRANLESKIGNWLSVGMTSQFTHRDLSGVLPDIRAAYYLSPYANLYYKGNKSDPQVFPQDDGLANNPLFGPIFDRNQVIYDNLFSNLYAIVKFPFVKGLSYRINYSPNLRWNENDSFAPIYQRNGLNNTGFARKSNQKNFDYTLENILTYERHIGDHEFDLTLLYGRDRFQVSSTQATGTNFFNDATGWDDLNLASVQQVSSSATTTNDISSMARLNYHYKDRYLLTLTTRRDGSSVFGADHKFGYFPSAAVAWLISDETFARKWNFLDMAKLRLSYGAVGNQAIAPYQSLDRSGTTDYVFGDGSPAYVGTYPSQLPNPYLGWETTKSKNIGLDFSVFKNVLSGTVEYYSTKTTGLLLTRALPSPVGFASVLTNIGSTQNNGIEVSLTSLNIKRSDLTWTTNFVFSTNKNKILDLYGNHKDDLGNRWFIGRPVHVAYDYTKDGIYQVGDANIPINAKPGYYRIRDINHDGSITTADRSVIGQLDPKYMYGLTNTFSYKGISLSFFINAVTGWIQSFYLLGTSDYNFPARGNMLDAGYWTPQNRSNTRPSLIFTNPYGLSYWASRNFCRLQDVSLSYTFKNSMVSRLKMSHLKIYVSGKNLYTLTKWPGFDPESGYNANDVDFPTARSVVAGLNVSF